MLEIVDALLSVSVTFLSLETSFDLAAITADPALMIFLILVGFGIGTGVGASGIGGAILLVPSLLYLGVPPQAVVAASLLFNFTTNIPSTLLHARKRHINYRALVYLMIPLIPSMFVAHWLWGYIYTSFGSETLDVVITLPIGIIVIGIGIYIMRGRLLNKKYRFFPARKKTSADSIDDSKINSEDTSEDKSLEYKTKITKREKGGLSFMGSLDSFIIQLTSIGGGVFMTPILLKVLHSPKHVAGTNLAFGLFAALVGVFLHFSIEDSPLYLVMFLVIGSIPGSYLGVRVATFTNPKKLVLLFAFIIFLAGILITNKGIENFSMIT